MSLPLRAVYGTTLPVRASCDCPRRVPLEGIESNVRLVRSLLGRLPRDLVLYTYRCRGCKRVLTLTAQDLLLSS
jgi:hypothetical protein